MERLRLASDLPIEQDGSAVHNELALTGWALAPVGISGVIVQIDDRLFHASYGLDTPWLVEALPDVPGSDRAGYRLQVDTSAWTPGPRTVTITAYDQKGGRRDLTGVVDVIPFGPPKYTVEENREAIEAGEIAMWLDQPAHTVGAPEVETPLEIAGWAYATGGVKAVLVTIDGTSRYEALHPVFRPDLLDDYGEQIAMQAGFVLQLHPRDCSPGWHRLSVVALDGEHQAVGIERDFVCLPEPPAAEEPERGEPMPVDWIPEPRPEPPRLRSEDRDPTGPDVAWEDRALLAEADAAASRNQANLARMHQEATQRESRTVQEDLAALRGTLAEVRAELAERETELESTSARLEDQSVDLAAVEQRAARGEQRADRAEQRADHAEQRADHAEQRGEALEGSLSWRITRPLRAIRRVGRRVIRRG